MSQTAVEVPRISIETREVQPESKPSADDQEKADDHEKPIDVAQV